MYSFSIDLARNLAQNVLGAALRDPAAAHFARCSPLAAFASKLALFPAPRLPLSKILDTPLRSVPTPPVPPPPTSFSRSPPPAPLPWYTSPGSPYPDAHSPGTRLHRDPVPPLPVPTPQVPHSTGTLSLGTPSPGTTSSVPPVLCPSVLSPLVSPPS